MLVICDSTKGLLFIPDYYPEPCTLVSFVDFIIHPEALIGNKLTFLEYTQNDSFIPTDRLGMVCFLQLMESESPRTSWSGGFRKR